MKMLASRRIVGERDRRGHVPSSFRIAADVGSTAHTDMSFDRLPILLLSIERKKPADFAPMHRSSEMEGLDPTRVPRKSLGAAVMP